MDFELDRDPAKEPTTAEMAAAALEVLARQSPHGFVLLVELASFTTIGAAQGKTFSIGGHTIDTTTPMPWVIALAALILGALWLRREAHGFRLRWDALLESLKRKGTTA